MFKFEKLIFANNKQYEINSINKFETFILKSKTLRNYYNKNILAFGKLNTRKIDSKGISIFSKLFQNTKATKIQIKLFFID